MSEYVTKQGDTLDLICFLHYGHASGAVELVLEKNYRLSSYGIEFPAGVKIQLPDIGKDKPVQNLINLWT